MMPLLVLLLAANLLAFGIGSSAYLLWVRLQCQY